MRVDEAVQLVDEAPETDTLSGGDTLSEADVEALVGRLGTLRAEIGKVIIGQEEAIEHLLVGLLADGHCLLEGVPGLAKTLMVRTLGAALELATKRIQFTPDLMPSDIIGTEILSRADGERGFRFHPGPIFANLVLADEINRSPPKTQAALLEAMEERAVTHGGVTHPLAPPFFVLATQNPIEQAGTYPLPEAQLDRFLLYLRIDYPSVEEEVAVLAATTGTAVAEAAPVLGAAEIRQAQALVRQVHISTDLLDYAARLVRATRPADDAETLVRDFVAWGAGPRAGQALVLAAKARALLTGRFAAGLEDLRAVALPVLRHRLVLSFRGQAERVDADTIARRLLETVAAPASPLV